MSVVGRPFYVDDNKLYYIGHLRTTCFRRANLHKSNNTQIHRRAGANNRTYTGRQAGRNALSLAHTSAKSLRDRQTDRYIDRQIDRHADRQINRQTDRHTETLTLTHADG